MSVITEINVNKQSRIAQILSKKRIFEEKMATAKRQGLFAVIQVSQQYGLTGFEQAILSEYDSKFNRSQNRSQNRPYNNNRGRY